MTAHERSRGIKAPLRVCAALVLVALTVVLRGGPHAAASSAQSHSASAIAALRRTIDATLNEPALSKASWGIAVRSMDRHDVLYRHAADKLLIPASTMKLVTLAAAAEILGWDYSFTTTLSRIGTPDNGVLDGDLIVTGTGDPSFDDWDGQASARFAEWAARLKEAGMTTVTGRLIGDDNAFDEIGLGNGWAWDDVAAGYSTAVGALQFNENVAQMVVTAGAADGEPAHVDVRPLSAALEFENLTITSAHGPPIAVQPKPRSRMIEVTGSIAPRSAPIVRNVSIPNPTLYFVSSARAALAANGIDIRGGAVDIDDVSPTPDQTAAVPIASFKSPPLSALASVMMKMSQNLFAESLLKSLGGAVGTAAGGRDRVLAVMSSWGIDQRDMMMVDGSGLSRYNLITADAQLAVLTHIYADAKLRGPFLEALPLVGVDGTLGRRMAGTRAEKNVRAKTGSFSNVRGLAGFVTTAEGESLAFSVLANNYNTPSTVIDRAMDAIVVSLAEFRR